MTVKSVLVLVCLVTIVYAQKPVATESPIAPLILHSQIVDLSPFKFRGPRDLTNLAQVDKRGRCAVHLKLLRETLVPINYGLRAYSERDRKLASAAPREFPNAITEIDGGCIAWEIKTARVMQCEACMALKAKKLVKGKA